MISLFYLRSILKGFEFKNIFKNIIELYVK
jgi:hypothetical protein